MKLNNIVVAALSLQNYRKKRPYIFRPDTPPAEGLNVSVRAEYIDDSGNRQSFNPLAGGAPTIEGRAPLLLTIDATGTRAVSAFQSYSGSEDAFLPSSYPISTDQEALALEAYSILKCGFSVNFGGGAGSGNWRFPENDPSPKNIDGGHPLWSVTLTEPGLRTIRVKTRDELNNEVVVSFQVNILPESTPTHIPVSAGSWPTFVDGTHYTLEADGDYRPFGALETGGLHGLLFSKVGEGADPIIGTWRTDSRSKFGETTLFPNRARNIRLRGIEITHWEEGQRGFEYCAAIDCTTRRYSYGGQAFLFNEGTNEERSAVRYSRGAFFVGGELNNIEGNTGGYCLFGTWKHLNLIGCEVNAIDIGDTTWAVLRTYGTMHNYRHSKIRISHSETSACGTPLSMLGESGLVETIWPENDLPAALGSADQYGLRCEHSTMYRCQIYDATSSRANAVFSTGGNPVGDRIVRSWLIGVEDCVWYPASDPGISINNALLAGRGVYWRNNRLNMGAGSYISYTTTNPNTLNNPTGTDTEWDGPYFAEEANSRPVPTPFEDAAPVFTVQPTNRTVTEGFTATFGPVTVTGVPTPTVQWQYWDGLAWVNIPGATETSYTTDVLTLADNNRQYSCLATNSQGSTRSSIALLTVQEFSSTPGITVQLNSTRTSGTAPLAVLFDTIGSTSENTTNPVKDLETHFNYGDERGENWPTTGRPKNRDTGGLMGAHVYTQPGTYTVSARVTDGTLVDQATMEITVADPDVVYAGTNTVCVDPTGGTTGGPTGAEYRTSIGTIESNKRYLLRRGQTFGDITLPLGTSGGQFGAYGEGAAPIVGMIYVQLNSSSTDWAHDWVFKDLQYLGFSAEISTRRILFLDCVRLPGASGATILLSIGGAIGYYYDNVPALQPGIYWPREIFFVGGSVRGIVNSTAEPQAVMAGYGDRSVFMGIEMDESTEHTVRLYNAKKFLMQHCVVPGNHYTGTPPGIRSCVKHHSEGIDPWISDNMSDGRTLASRYVVFRRNIFGSVDFPSSYLTGSGPQNADLGTLEGLEDVIYEDNHFIYGSFTVRAVQVFGRNMILRRNTRDNGGIPDLGRGDNYDPGLDAWDGPYFGLTTEATPQITVNLAATRLSGPAPLAVLVEATGTTSTMSGVTDTFRQLTYEFDFDDPDSGVWPISGRSKNEEIGAPVAAHVFTEPGTYVIMCTARRGTQEAVDYVTITVQDPNEVYSGTNTVFVSPSGDFTDAPPGAQTVTSIPTIVSDRRYILNRGESFGALNWPHGVSRSQVIAGPGTGAKPIVSGIQVGTGAQPPDSNFPEEVTIVGLNNTGTYIQSSYARRQLYMDCDQPNSGEVTIGSAAAYWADPSRYGPTMPYVREWFLVNVYARGTDSTNSTTGDLIQSAILGCDFQRAIQHTMRPWFGWKGVIAHNAIRGVSNDGIRHALKLHSDGENAMTEGATFGDVTGRATRWVNITHNLFGDLTDNNQFTVVIGPENGIVQQGLEDVIVENNRFIRGSNWVSDLQLSGRRMTYINNTLVSNGDAAAVTAPGLHNEGLPVGWDGPYFTSRI